MSELEKVSNEDILWHIANSVDSFTDNELHFGVPWVQNGRLGFRVTDDDGNQRKWILTIERDER
jgi:hypothetical protein